MASLKDTMQPKKKVVKRDGRLQEVTGNELNTLASAVGRQAAPTSPLGATGIGASPDAAKMAGTPNQLATSFRAALQGDMSLRDAERTGKVARQQQAQLQFADAQQKGVEAYKGLAELNKLVETAANANLEQGFAEVKPTVNQDAVTEAAGRAYKAYEEGITSTTSDFTKQITDKEAAIASLKAKKFKWYEKEAKRQRDAQVAQLTKDLAELKVQQSTYEKQATSGLAKIDEATKAKINAVLEKVVANPDALDTLTPQETQILAQALGKDLTKGEKITGDDVRKALFQTAEEQVVLQQVTAGQLLANEPEMRAEMMRTLGLTEAELSKMSVEQLQDAVAAVEAAEFDTGDELRRLAANAPTGSAEAREYLQMLEDFGAVSGEAAEVEFAALEKAIQGAEEIEFMGVPMTIDELLSDKKASQIIATYYHGSEDEKKELEEKYPALFNSLNKYEEVMTQLSKGIDREVGQVQELQDANKALANTTTGAVLSDEVMDIFYPGYDPNRLEAIPESTSAVYQALKDPESSGLDASQWQTLYDEVNSLVKLDPKLAKQLSKLSLFDLRQIGMFNGGITSMLATNAALDAQDQRAAKPEKAEEYLSVAFNELGIPDGELPSTYLQDLLTNLTTIDRLAGSSPEEKELKSILDSNGDGVLDSVAAIHSKLKKSGLFARDTIENRLKGIKTPSLATLARTAVDNLTIGQSNLPDFLSRLVPYLKGGSLVTPENFNKFSADTAWNNYPGGVVPMEAAYEQMKPFLTPETQAIAEETLRRAGVREFSEHAKVTPTLDWPDNIAHIRNVIANNGFLLNSDVEALYAMRLSLQGALDSGAYTSQYVKAPMQERLAEIERLLTLSSEAVARAFPAKKDKISTRSNNTKGPLINFDRGKEVFKARDTLAKNINKRLKF